MQNCKGNDSKYPHFQPRMIKEGDIDSLCTLLSSPNEKIRSKAIEFIEVYVKIYSFPDYVKGFRPLMQHLPREENQKLQEDIMSLLWSFPDSLFREKDRQLFLEIAADTNKSVTLRRKGFILLNKLHDDRAVELALSIVKEAQSNYELFYPDQLLGFPISYLSYLKYLPAIPEIKKIFKVLFENRQQIEGAMETYRECLSTFRHGYGDKITPYLDSLLTSDCDTVRFYAAIELGFMKKNQAIPVLIEMLKDSRVKDSPHTFFKVAGINAIRELRAKEAIPLLKNYLNDTTATGIAGTTVGDLAASVLKTMGIKVKKYEKNGKTYYKLEEQ